MAPKKKAAEEAVIYKRIVEKLEAAGVDPTKATPEMLKEHLSEKDFKDAYNHLDSVLKKYDHEGHDAYKQMTGERGNAS